MKAKLTIDLGAIAANWRALDALSGPACETAAVVKADAYGLGIVPVAKALATAGARTFFVAQTEEAAKLRVALGVGPEIYVFGGIMEGDAPLLRAASAIPLINSLEQAARIAADPMPHGLQIDTGMNRLGLEPADLAHLTLPIPRLTISHLACADTPDHPQNAEQRAVFEAHTFGPRSLSATGGTLMGEPFHYDMTRPGIGLYGGHPFAQAQPVVTLSLPVIQVRDVAPGETVGYGAAWTATRPSRIATVSSGYADGLIRATGNGDVHLYARNTPCPLIGRVSMDLITVDVTDLPDTPTHLDILNAHQRIDDLADAAGTIGYEILTSLGARYDRRYINGNPE